MEEKNESGSRGGAIGAVIGTIVLAAAFATGGWIANDMWSKIVAEKMKELQKLVLEEDMSVLKTLEFKVKRKKQAKKKEENNEVKEESDAVA